MGLFKIYWSHILADREWSWSLVGAAYLIFVITLRQLLFRGLIREIREADSAAYALIRGLYLKKSLAGWIFFTGSFLLAVTGWINLETILHEKTMLALFCILLPLLYSLSVIFHFMALMKALLTTHRQRMDVEKEF